MKITIDNANQLEFLLSVDSPYNEIHLKKGVYNGKFVISKNGLKVTGDDGVIITNHDFYSKIHKDNKEYNTFRTYTLKVLANNVTLQNLTIENSCVPSSAYGQAVALHVMGTNFTCDSCVLKGAQDTLFTGPLPKNLLIRYKDFLPDSELTETPSIQKYINTKIVGDVDFIFGGATAYFYQCEIECIGDKGYVCAPSHSKDTRLGYLFHECRITNPNKLKHTFYLARPWREYGFAAFINCELDQHILPIGFNDWNDSKRQKTARFFEFSSNIDLSSRANYAHILTEKEAQELIDCFIKETKS